jgi:MFS transporter, putative metabolite:H+ symporter
MSADAEVGASIAARLNRLPLTRAHRGMVGMAALGYFFEIFDIMLSSVLAAVLQKTFALSNSFLSLTVAASFLGMFVGSLVVGRLSDSYGRRFGFFFNLLVYSVFTILAAFSMNAWWLVGCRFLGGVGLGAQYPVIDVYLNDMMPAKKRGRCMMWAFTIGVLAYPVIALLSYAIVPTSFLGASGWRYMFVIGGLGAVIGWIFQRRLLESPRWLEAVGRQDEAEALTARLEEAARASDGGAALTAPVEEVPVIVSLHPWRLLFSREIRRRTFMIYVADFLQSWGFYGFGTIATLVLVSKGYTITSSLLYTFVTFLGYPIGSWLSVYYSDRWERKTVLCVTAVIMGLLGLAFADSSVLAVILILGFLYTAVSEQFSNAIHMYQAEVFPTAARSTGAGSAYSLSRLSNALLPFVLLPVLHSAGAVAVFGIVGLSMLILIVDVGIFGPRTVGIAVEQIGQDSGIAGRAAVPPTAGRGRNIE